MSDCIFCKIAAGEIPCRKVYEDETLIAFHDINPAAPVHFMIVPKAHVDSLADCQPQHEAVLGRILLLAPKLAQEQGLKQLLESSDYHNKSIQIMDCLLEALWLFVD